MFLSFIKFPIYLPFISNCWPKLGHLCLKLLSYGKCFMKQYFTRLIIIFYLACYLCMYMLLCVSVCVCSSVLRLFKMHIVWVSFSEVSMFCNWLHLVVFCLHWEWMFILSSFTHFLLMFSEAIFCSHSQVFNMIICGSFINVIKAKFE